MMLRSNLHYGSSRLPTFLAFSSSTYSAGSPMAPNNKSLFQQHAFLRLVELPPDLSASPLFSSQERGEQFLKAGSIHGIVVPDLPPKFSLAELFPYAALKSKLYNPESISKHTEEDLDLVDSSQSLKFKCWHVRTVAAQTRSLQDLCSRMVNAGTVIDTGEYGGALLLVSGGHFLRSFWPANRLLPVDSFAMLRAAKQLRQTGLLAPRVQLWAVENPLVNTIDRLEKKIEAGAEAIIVQPPLLQDRFAKWWENANQKGLLDAAHVIVGLPIISSARNLGFWLELTKASGKEAEAILGEFVREEACMDSSEKAAFCRMWTLNLADMIENLPGVAGIHMMPMTPYGWRQLADFLSKGEL